MASISQKMHNKKGMRAKKEGEIVKACIEYMAKKIGIVDTERRAQLALLEDIENEFLKAKAAGEEKITLQIMASNYQSAREELEAIEKSVTLFLSTQDALRRLSAQVQALLRYEWYSYVIRTIPEKKLPAMIHSESEKDMAKVRDLALKIIEKINNRILLEAESKKEGDEKIRRAQEVAGSLLEENARDEDAKLNALEKAAMLRAAKRAAQTNEMPVPVSAQAAEESQAKTIKA
ncbi:MAG: hypothetical protein J6A46_03945 [Clostridia bacterium]|nr:hypothetical protein [Clostridia bacterium]